MRGTQVGKELADGEFRRPLNWRFPVRALHTPAMLMGKAGSVSGFKRFLSGLLGYGAA
jgi:hypothetical protein